jgi:hypothetical protein
MTLGEPSETNGEPLDRRSGSVPSTAEEHRRRHNGRADDESIDGAAARQSVARLAVQPDLSAVKKEAQNFWFRLAAPTRHLHERQKRHQYRREDRV